MLPRDEGGHGGGMVQDGRVRWWVQDPDGQRQRCRQRWEERGSRSRPHLRRGWAGSRGPVDGAPEHCGKCLGLWPSCASPAQGGTTRPTAVLPEPLRG